MGVRRAAYLGVALAALMSLAPAVASADEALQTTGSLVYAWHGDPARGCAQVGVCGVHGALVIRAQNGAQVVSLDSTLEMLQFVNVSATVRVQGGDLGPGGSCVDQAEGDLTSLGLTSSPGGAVSADYGGAVSSGHCAGPTSQDFARILIRGRRSRARRPTYDFRGSTPFTAGPFSGTLNSTLVLSPQGAGGGGVSFSSGTSGPPRTHRVLLEHVVLRYRVATPPSALGISFAGEPGPFCTALNTCGASGSLSFSFPRLQSEVEISATKIVKAPVSRRQALRDFRAGKLPIVGAPPVDWVVPRLSETFKDAGTCADAVPEPSVGLGFGSFGLTFGAHLPVTVSVFTQVDPLRTHCPGPEAPDVLEGPNETLAGTRISRRTLLQRHWTFTLRATGGFGVPGYVGARTGQLPVSMSLLKVIAGTQTGQSS